MRSHALFIILFKVFKDIQKDFFYFKNTMAKKKKKCNTCEKTERKSVRIICFMFVFHVKMILLH